MIRAGKLAVDVEAKRAEVNGTPLRLTAKEYAVLELLAINKGTVLAPDSIRDYLYGDDLPPRMKTLPVFIHRLRRKLAEACGDSHIVSIVGRGYALRELRQG